MNLQSIFIPFFGMMILTLSVWLYLYYLRLSYLIREKINPQSIATTREMNNIVPEKINWPSENLNNLFELPILFYAVCIYLYVTQQVDDIYLALAYGFLLFRIMHSVVHCKYNKVIHRFYIYILSSFMLWIIIIRALINAITV